MMKSAFQSNYCSVVKGFGEASKSGFDLLPTQARSQYCPNPIQRLTRVRYVWQYHQTEADPPGHTPTGETLKFDSS